MPDRLFAEAERMLQEMEQRFGLPPRDIETSGQEPRGDDTSTSPVSTHPAGGQQADGGAAR